ncbi:Very-short-patch-repair endonuclease [Seinonella peptonophila]|uniref:Very-short-patch-repair endonuclease n=1 Tax=Seinonella peptonophila TaxID=112248 RepID=A0A1M4SUK4_9BACL|nr:DUF559 domain-containing protein [Seinonella peptonophila]SHE35667.1 Very-short-patch-repair endonuclease [Seinonella peptonophila]
MAPLHVALRRERRKIKRIFKFIYHLMKSRKIPDWQWIKCDSPIEEKMYFALKRRGYKVITQYQTCGYEVDLVLRKHRIAIECDGYQHHHTAEQRKRDQKKSRILRSNGWKVIRLSGKEIYHKIDHCIEKVQLQIGKRKSI